MKKELREVLEKPFPAEVIKQRDGSYGRKLDYVEGHAVIQRLTESFDGEWSFEVQSYQVFEEEVVVLGKLVTNGIVKSQFGSSSITRAKETGKPVSIGDDIKAAATDALKKCATLMGVQATYRAVAVGLGLLPKRRVTVESQLASSISFSSSARTLAGPRKS
jgi:recombination DNA repair RAD52 pathway protein